jgi:hypothetical protein
VKYTPIAIMDKRSHWPFSVKKFPPAFDMPKPFEIDPAIIKSIYEERYKENPGDDPIDHLQKFEKRCDSLEIKNVSNERIKVKMFPYFLAARSLDWFLNWPLGTFHSWYNIKDLVYFTASYLFYCIIILFYSHSIPCA